ncbi:MAG: HigA family addiction module antitoxin [Planctomycetota bacterium]
MAKKVKLLKPIHPGEILLEEFLKPFGISINRLARDIDVPPGRVSLIVNGKRGITADTALRLAKYFRVSAELWMGLQSDYDLRVAQRRAGVEIERRVRSYAVAAKA